MLQRTDDLRITETRPLIPPAILLEEIPVSETASNVVSDTRAAVSRVIAGSDPRLIVIAGPCSIHDTKAALEYASRLKVLADRFAGRRKDLHSGSAPTPEIAVDVAPHTVRRRRILRTRNGERGEDLSGTE